MLLEVHRVLAAGGRLVICDLFHDGPLPDDFRRELDAWAWCLGGTVDRRAVGPLLTETGFRLQRFELEETIDRFRRAALGRKRSPTAEGGGELLFVARSEALEEVRATSGRGRSGPGS